MIYCTNKLVRKIAESCARGAYQRELVDGSRRWSGSDCNNRWGAKYHASREAMRARFERAGLDVGEYTVSGKVFLVLGADEWDTGSVDSDTLLDAWR